MHRSTTRRFQAFTLIELLVVISIIALLVSILLPALSGARESAVNIQCMSQMRTINTGHQRYIDDYNDYLASWLYPTFFETLTYEPKGYYVDLPAKINSTNSTWHCPAYAGYAENPYRNVYSYWVTYTHNRAAGRPTKSWDTGTITGQAKLAELRALSEKAIFMDGLADGTTSIQYAKNIIQSSTLLNRHAGLSNNYAFLDGHVANYGKDEIVYGGTTAQQLMQNKIWRWRE